MAYITAVILAVIITVQARDMIKKGLYPELAVYLVLSAVGAIFIYSIVLDLDIPGPSLPIKLVFAPISKLLFPDYSE